MIGTYCNDNIVNIFTHCSAVKEVYTYGQLVWPTGPSYYYVSWLPTNISGSFTMEGISYSLQDYNGYFSGFAGVITPSAFGNTGMSYMETNAYSIDSFAFVRCKSLTWASMSKCTYLNSRVFESCWSLSSVYAPKLISTSYGTFQNCSALSQISLPLLTHLGQNTFRYCSNLSSVYLPMCKSISADAFNGCRSLSQINLPLCNYLGAGTFNGCSSLSSVSLPICVDVMGSAFANCTSLSHIELPICKSIGPMTFYNCSSLSSVGLPMCEYIGESAFQNCTALSQIELPACKSIGANYSIFAGTHLERIILPVCQSLGANAFADCSYLSSVEFGSCTWIADGAFARCSSLTTLILSGSSMCSVDTNYAFSGTPFKSCIGSILVPGKLLGMYKRAPVWSDLSCVIYPLSSTPGSYYINWTPSDLSSGSFTLEGYTQYFADFSGSYTWFDGVIDAHYVSSASIYEGAFAYTSISTIITNAYKVESRAFDLCKSLTAASFPNCSYIGDYTFDFCSSLTTLSLPVCEYLGNGVFESCSRLKTLNLPMCKSIGNYAFSRCSNLTTLKLSRCEYIGGSVFAYCSKLKTLNLPMCKSIGDYAFSRCSLTTIKLPRCEYIGKYAFGGYSLTTLDLPMCKYIGNWTFEYCGSSLQVILGNSSVCKLNGYLGLGFSGAIYVPSSLVDAYRSAINWSNFSSRIFPIES